MTHHLGAARGQDEGDVARLHQRLADQQGRLLNPADDVWRGMGGGRAAKFAGSTKVMLWGTQGPDAFQAICLLAAV